jgi:hypothetical protein
VAEQRDAERAAQRLVEDDGAPVRGDQRVIGAAKPIGDGEDRQRRHGHQNVHAVQAAGALETGMRDRRQSCGEGPAVVDQPDRQAGEEDERLGAVGQGEIARREMLQQVAGQMVDRHRHENQPAGKVDGGDARRHGHGPSYSRSAPRVLGCSAERSVTGRARPRRGNYATTDLTRL